MRRSRAKDLPTLLLCSAVSFLATPAASKSGSAPARAGVVVETESDGSAAQKAGIEPGDVGPGLVVETLSHLSLAEKAGIRTGDLLLSWERLANPPANPEPARGVFRSPFDVLEVNVEQVPRGPVKVVLERDGQRMTLVVPASGRLPFVRPNFKGGALSEYVAGLEALKSGDPTVTFRIWRGLATAWSASGDHAHAAWMFYRSGLFRDDFRSEESQPPLADALTEARKLGDPRMEAFIWVAKSETQLTAALATEYQLNALRLRESLEPDSLAVAKSFFDLGGNLITQADPVGARAVIQHAFEMDERLAPGSAVHALALEGLFHCSMLLNDFDAAERYGLSSQAILERVDPDSRGMVSIFSIRDVLARSRGDLTTAEVLARQSLALSNRLDPGGHQSAGALMDLAAIAQERGDLAAAEDFYRKASVIIRRYRLPDSDSVARLWEMVGMFAQTRGDLVAAEDAYQHALANHGKINPNGINVAGCLVSLGDLARIRGDFSEATARYTRALDAFQSTAPESLDTAATLTALGRAALDGGNPAAAKGYFEHAQALCRRQAPGGLLAARNLTSLAEAESALGAVREAERHYKEALKAFEAAGTGAPGHAEALHGLGLLALRDGRRKEASAMFGRALVAVEARERHLGGPDEALTDFHSRYAGYYFDLLDLELQMGRTAEAFAVLERSRAHSMLTLLAERDLSLETDVPADLDLERRRLDAEYDRIQAELSGTSPQEDRTKAHQAAERLRELRGRRAEIVDRIKAASPRYARLRYPQPLDLKATRSALEPGSLLLSYSVGKRKTLLFAVEPQSVDGPGLTVFSIPIDENELRRTVDDYRGSLNGRGAPILGPAKSLYGALLGPAQAVIAKYDRLLILPDGPLHTLPWAALVREVESGPPQYLVEWKPIDTAVSATVYAELKKPRRPDANTGTTQVAAFGDPRYPKLPEKKAAVKRGEGGPEGLDPLADEFAEVEDPQLRSVARSGYRLDPLPASRKEVEQIASLYFPRSVAFLGAEATEERAKAIGKDVPIIHFATHAIINERFPLDSALVFTIPEHPKEGQDNGLLQAWEIFEQMRIDADLVTLSACESGLGKEMGGEGLIGLTRAFQYAGARSVLASLWKVEDKATAELMKRFYTYLKAGRTKDEALRSAQIDLIHSKEYSNPRDWAGFQLNGDWK